MAFDPDAYLAEKTKTAPVEASKGGFDPDAYLAEKAPKSPDDMHSTEEVSPAILAGIPPPVSGPKPVASAPQPAPPAGQPGQPPAQAGQPPMPTPEKPLGGAPGLPEPKKAPTLSMPDDGEPWYASKMPDIPGGIREGVMSMASGMIAKPASDIAGLAAMGKEMISPTEGGGDPEGFKKSVQESLTFEPKSAVGKAVAKYNPISLLGQAISSGADYVGSKIRGDKAADSPRGMAGNAVQEALVQAPGLVGALKGKSSPKGNVPVPGKDVSPLRDFTAEEGARYDRLKSQGIQPTLGEVTRDPAQFKYEDQTAAIASGRDLSSRKSETNSALIKAVEDTDTLQAGKSTTENARQTGHSVAVALERNAKESMSNIDSLYKAARDAGETKAIVNIKPLEKYLKQHEAESISVPELNSIKSKLETLKAQGEGKGGVSIDSYEELYKAANQLAKPGDSSSHFMRDVKNEINKATKGVGGDLYRKARQARLEHGFEFEDRVGIARLIEKKSGSRTDYKTANEDVFNKTVVNGSLEELKDVSRSLLKADPKTHPESWQAVRNLQAQTIEHVLERARQGVSTDAKGNPILTPSGMRQGIKSIGTDKLEYLLGKDAVKRLKDVEQSAIDTRSQPGRVTGSDTMANAAVRMEKAAKKSAANYLLSHLGWPGKVIGGVADYFTANKEIAAEKLNIKEALNPRMAAPETIDSGAKAAKKVNRQYLMSQAKPVLLSPTSSEASKYSETKKKEEEKKIQEEEDKKQKRQKIIQEAIGG